MSTNEVVNAQQKKVGDVDPGASTVEPAVLPLYRREIEFRMPDSCA